MQNCPHCNKPGIREFNKLISVSFAPARCELCGRQSYLHVAYALMALSTWIILTWLLIGLAYFLQASILLLGSIPALALAIDLFMLKAPMVPVRNS